MDQPERDRRLYEKLVEDHAAGLYRVALRMSGNANDADDLVQETYEQAWRSMKQLRSPDSSFPWLLQIMRFRYVRFVKARKKERALAMQSLEAAAEAQSGEGNIGQSLEDSEMLQLALDQLDDRFKLPLLLVVMEGLSVNETASALGIRRGTVLSRVHRAKQSLLQILERCGMSRSEFMTDSRSR